MTSLPAATGPRSSASSSTSTPASAARPAPSTARNGTPAAISAPLTDQRPLRRRPARRLVQPRAHYEAGEGADEPHGAFPALLPALRGAGLRHRLPDRRLLQARRGRHRAGRRGHLHRLQAVLLGLPLRRARVRRRRRRHEEMHAVRRPHLQRDPRRSDRVPACVAACPAAARHFGDLGDPELRRLAAGRRARRLRPDAGDRLQAGQQVPAAARRASDAPAPRARRAELAHRARSRRRPSLAALGRPACCRAETPCIPRSPSSSSPPPRAPATACCSCSALLAPARRCCRRAAGSASSAFGAGARLATARPARLDLPSRPAGARLARLLAMAHVLAVARGRRRGRRPTCRRPASAIGWVFLGQASCHWLGLLAALGAVVTIFCTAMIYASLKPIPRWHNRLGACRTISRSG